MSSFVQWFVGQDSWLVAEAIKNFNFDLANLLFHIACRLEVDRLECEKKELMNVLDVLRQQLNKEGKMDVVGLHVNSLKPSEVI